MARKPIKRPSLAPVEKPPKRPGCAERHRDWIPLGNGGYMKPRPFAGPQ